jgi:hypothetical protein
MQVLETSKITDELWEKYFDFEKAILVKNQSEKKMADSNGQEFKASNLTRYKALEALQYMECLLIDRKDVVGRFDAGVDFGILAFGFVTIYDVLQEEILEYILKGVYERMMQLKVTESYYWSFEEDINELLIKIGADKTEELILSCFEKDKANTELFKKWIEVPEHDSRFKIVFYKNLPEDLMNEYVRFVNPVFKDIDSLNPFLDRKPITITKDDLIRWNKMDKVNNNIKYYYILFNEKEEIAALTCVIINKNNTSIIRYNNGLTAVGREYRGQGLGKYLKAKMFFKLEEDFPEFKFIHTDTMPWNKYMFKINEEFGFKPFKKGAKFRFTKEFLENYLKINK